MTEQLTSKLKKSELLIMHTPRSLDLEITSQCNLRCRYCYYFNNPDVDYHDLPTDEWVNFFDECGRCAIMNVTLQGGEPFMRKDLPRLIDGIVRNRMRFSILSNGMLIDDNIASFIASTKRCNSIQISVDGSRPEIHDACRGEGSFVGAIRGIQTLKRYKIPVKVRVTINRQNVYDLENIAKFLIKKLGLKGFSTNSAGYLGSCRLNAKEVLLNTSERQLAMKTLKNLSEKYKGRISATAGPLSEAQNWLRMEKARLQGDQPFGGFLIGCNGPNNKVAVRADGAIVPCTMLAHMKLGQINQDSLKEVWQHSSDLNKFRQRHTIPLIDFDFCDGCPYIPYCTGNCPGLAYSLTGRVNHPSPDACLRKFLEEGGKLPIEKNNSIVE